MIEYIKALIIGIITGITAPLPVSSSGHFYAANALLGFSRDRDVLSFYYSFFMLIFSVVIFISLKDVYIKTFKSSSRKQKNYKLRLGNLLLSLFFGVLLFIPIPKLGKSLSDFFDSFLSADSFLNPVLIGFAGVFSGLLLIISLWYSKKTGSKGKKTVPVRSSLRMYIYSLPAYIIPGASRISLSSVNLILCDVSPSVILREVYFYTAPTVFVVNLVRIVITMINGIDFDPISLTIGLVAVALCAMLIVGILRKADIKKLLGFFSVYSILFGVAVGGLALINLVSGT